MRLIVAAVLAVLAVPAYAGGLCHRASGLPPLYGGGYAPLDYAATVFPAPRWCRCSVSPRVVSISGENARFDAEAHLRAPGFAPELTSGTARGLPIQNISGLPQGPATGSVAS